MRVKVDENLPSTVADMVREGGHDAETVIREGLGGHADPLVIQAAKREGRAFITLDTGFGDIRAYPPADLPGIIVLRPQTQAIPDILAVTRAMLVFAVSTNVAGHLWIVELRRVRVRG